MQKNNFSNKNMKLSHSRVSLSGIFDACSYQIGKTLFSKRQLRRRSRTKTFRDDSLCFYERQAARGFTLIELLVVVLIIGILAAVALPQYKVAVSKSKVSAILPLIKNLQIAEDAYFLAHGEYANDPQNLDIDLPSDCTMLDNNTQRWACGDFFVAINAAYSITPSYCPGYSTDRTACMQHRDFYIRFPFREYSTTYECVSFSNLGKAVCASFEFKASEG